MKYSIFHEEQHTNNLLRWMMGLILLIVPVLSMGTAIVEKVKYSNTDDLVITVIVCIVCMLMCLLIGVAVIMITMETTIDEKGVHAQYYIRPFPNRMRFRDNYFSWDEITQITVNSYAKCKLYRFGGRHYTFTPNFITRRTVGMYIILKNNIRVFICTNEPENLIHVLKKLGKLDKEG
jgi:hypothetical protein